VKEDKESRRTRGKEDDKDMMTRRESDNELVRMV